jgi:ABC-type polysaccharide/polyol phosphate transport system ATPase subunit
MTKFAAPPKGEMILRVSGVHKLYARRRNPTQARLGEAAARALTGRRPPEIGKLRPFEFWALRDISFELARGEALGVIGLNGSGKTTLLRILAGQMLPDRGEVWIGGSSAAMIDLQAGFQPSASGRENIFFRAAALGYSRAQTGARLQQIIEFSELGEAIDAPMAGYSSGMKMRLAFSVMAMVEPDVLLVDEVLSVGDFRFRQKSLAKIREMRAKSAFVLVSHSMNNVETFCDRVIVLHKGECYFIGEPREAIEIYQTLDHSSAAADSPAHLARVMGETFVNDAAIKDVAHYWCDEHDAPVEERGFVDSIRLSVKFTSTIDIRNLIVGVPVWNINAHYTTGLSTQITSDKFDVKAGDRVELMLEIDGGVINPGTIKSMMTILDGPEFLYRQQNPDIVINGAAHPTWGAVTLPHKWKRLGARTEMVSAGSAELRAGTAP